MPFAYYGAKHKLARLYPPPTHDTIIEPFAGAAGYSCYWASRRVALNVMLFDLNPYIVALWHRLQHMTAAEVDAAIDDALASERTREPLLAFMGGGSTIAGIIAGRDRQVTPRMREDNHIIRRRIKRVLPYIADWSITHDSYLNCPNMEATWFVDPPYQPLLEYRHEMGAGDAYTFGASGIDYQQLADWCLAREGQVIVCEQHPAAWLPFTTLVKQVNGSNRPSERTEVIWHRCERSCHQIGLDL